MHDVLHSLKLPNLCVSNAAIAVGRMDRHEGQVSGHEPSMANDWCR
jgi:hypothetical protein